MSTYTELAQKFKDERTEKNFAALYYKLRPSLKHYINGFTKDSDITEDLLATTFQRIYEKFDSFDPEAGAITTWSHTIAKRLCLRWIKREKKVFTSLDAFRENGSQATDDGEGNTVMSSLTDVEYELEGLTTEDELWDQENSTSMQYNLVVQAINELKPMYRDILIDNLINGMMYKDIAYKIDDKLNNWRLRLEDIRMNGGVVSPEDEKKYTKYYKKILQRVKNRIRRGKMIIEEYVNENLESEES